MRPRGCRELYDRSFCSAVTEPGACPELLLELHEPVEGKCLPARVYFKLQCQSILIPSTSVSTGLNNRAFCSAVTAVFSIETFSRVASLIPPGVFWCSARSRVH